MVMTTMIGAMILLILKGGSDNVSLMKMIIIKVFGVKRGN